VNADLNALAALVPPAPRYPARVEDESLDQEGLRDRVQNRSEQAIGDLAEALLENPVFNSALSAAFGAREKAIGAQQAAMGALNLPSASEVERLERRLRSLSQRLEAVEEQMDGVARDVAAIRRELAGQTEVAADQARLDVHSGKP
jgi:chromosome segregation ATPase